jgi:hypothetical protein
MNNTRNTRNNFNNRNNTRKNNRKLPGLGFNNKRWENLNNIGNSYFNEGEWKLCYVPLKKIDYRKWAKNRYNSSLKLIRTLKTVQPIILSDYDKGLNKYQLIDGNHRCFVCNELGYTHIPAFVDKDIEDKSFITYENANL